MGQMQMLRCYLARNFGRFVAGGSAGHSGHGRDCIEALQTVAHGETEIIY